MTDTKPLIEVDNLRVRLNTSRGPADAVRGVSFSLARGETLGLIGESGCGKSVTAMALMGLLPESAEVSGSVRLDGQELIGLDEADYCKLRGNRMSMIFQEPMTALNPMHTVGRQVGEPLRRHKGFSAAQAHRGAIALLDRVGLPDAAKRADAYPHQFSGGQRQRITIAMALACEPDLLIADEPTTALDVTIQGQILDLIADLVAERGMSMILISHDLGVIAENVQRMMVMYGGTVVENGTIEAPVRRPRSSLQPGPVPRPAAARRTEGDAPENHPRHGAGACGPAFRLRVRRPLRYRRRTLPRGLSATRHRQCRPHRALPAHRCLDGEPGRGRDRMSATANAAPEPMLLEVDDLVQRYTLPRENLFEPAPEVLALNGVSVRLAAGKSLGVVGESGSGKSTFARVVMALETPTSGSVRLLGRDLHRLPAGELRHARRDFQMVFQDP